MTIIKKVAIDLGTSNCLVWAEEEVVLKEPSVVAVGLEDRKILAIGEEVGWKNPMNW